MIYIVVTLLMVAVYAFARRQPAQRYNLRNPVYGTPKNVKWQDGRPYTTD